MPEEIKQIAPGYLVTFMGGRQIYVNIEKWDENAKYYTFPVELVTEVTVMVKGAQVQCQAKKLAKSVFGIMELKAPITSISTVERISQNSFIYQAVIQAATGLKIVGGQFS